MSKVDDLLTELTSEIGNWWMHHVSDAHDNASECKSKAESLKAELLELFAAKDRTIGELMEHAVLATGSAFEAHGEMNRWRERAANSEYELANALGRIKDLSVRLEDSDWRESALLDQCARLRQMHRWARKDQLNARNILLEGKRMLLTTSEAADLVMMNASEDRYRIDQLVARAEKAERELEVLREVAGLRTIIERLNAIHTKHRYDDCAECSKVSELYNDAYSLFPNECLEKFEMSLVTRERERCAKVCESRAEDLQFFGYSAGHTCGILAAEIRKGK